MADNPYAAFADPVTPSNPYSSFADPVGPAGDQPGPNAPQSYGVNGVARAVARNLLENVVIGTGKTLANTPQFSDSAHETGNWLQNQGKAWERQMEVADDQYGTPHTQAFQWNKPSTWSEAPYAVAETLPSAGVSLAMPEAKGLGFIASEAAQHYGQRIEDRMANQPAGATPSTEDQIMAGASTLGQAAVGKYGLGKVTAPIKGLGAGIPGAVAKTAGEMGVAAGANAGAGAVGDLIDQTGRNLGTANGQSSPDWQEAANAGAMGAVTGAGLRGVRLPGDVLNATRMSPLGGTNAEASADLANRLGESQTGVSTSTPSGAYKANELVRMGLDAQASRAEAQARPVIDSVPGLPVRLDDAQIKIKAGQVLPERTLSSLQSDLGDQQGAQLAHLLRVQNAQNILKNMGNFDSSDKTFAGGLSGSTVGKMLNPFSTLKALGAHAAAGSVGALGLLEMGHGGMLVSLLPKIVGVGIAATAGLRGIDAMMGTRNPTQEFLNRFQGRPVNAPGPYNAPAAPSGPPTSVPSVGRTLPPQLGPNGPWGNTPPPGVPAIYPKSPTAAQLKSLVGKPLPNTTPASPGVPKLPKGMTSSSGSMGSFSGPSFTSAEPTPAPSGPPGYIPPSRSVSPAEVAAFIAKANGKPATAPQRPAQPDIIVPEVKTPEAPIAAPEAPKAKEKAKAKPTEDQPDIVVTHRGETVTRPFVDSNGNRVKDLEAYKSEIMHHIDARANLRDDLKIALPKGAHGGGAELVDALMKDLHSRHMTQDRAETRIERFFEAVPASKKTAVAKILGRHIPNVMGTFDQ